MIITAKQRPGIMIYFELLDEMTELTDEECGALFRDMLVYGRTGVLPEYSDRTMRTMWKLVQTRLDNDARRYYEISEARTEAGRKGGRPRKQSESNEKQIKTKKPIAFLEKQNNPTTTSTTTSTTTTIKADKSPAPAHFAKPTVEEVEAYCIEKGLSLDPHAFVDYYTSNGWMVGRGHMKDWRAAARNWERREKKQGAPARRATSASFSPDDFDFSLPGGV